MQQHPIPQNVMQVEFQLVGNLTLRQFGYLAAGGMITFMAYLLPLPDLIKWPIVLTLAVFFAALVWLPINDMGLDRWVVAFFRAINNPTKRVWHKEAKALTVFSRDYTKQLLKSAVSPIVPDRSRLEGFLKSLSAQAPKSDLDLAEQSYLDSLPFNIGNPPPPPPPPILAPEVPAPVAVAPPPPPPPPPPPKEAELPPEPHVVEEDLTKPAPPLTSIKPVITVHLPNKNLYVKKVGATEVNRSLHPLSSLQGTIVLPVRGERTFELSSDIKERLYPEQTITSVGEAGINPTPLPPGDAGGYVPTPVPTSAPLSTPTDVKRIAEELAQEAAEASKNLAQAAPLPPPTVAPAPAPVAPPPPPAPEVKKAAIPAAPAPDRSTEKKSLPTAAPEVKKSAPAGVSAPPAVGKMAPPPAGVPNVIVGMVRTNQGLLLADVVIIVKDTDGEPVRALKSNKVGQFAISTPLPNGDYQVDFEKEGFQFDTIAVALTGEIFQPIEVRAK